MSMSNCGADVVVVDVVNVVVISRLFTSSPNGGTAKRSLRSGTEFVEATKKNCAAVLKTAQR